MTGADEPDLAATTDAMDTLRALIQDAGGNLALATARLSGDPAPGEAILGERLAGLAWIDEPLYRAITSDLTDVPLFAALTGPDRPWFLPDRLVAQTEGRFGWGGDAPAERDRAWSLAFPLAHRAWHCRLAKHFAAEGRVLDQLRHSHIADLPEAATLFGHLFAQALAAADVPAMHTALQAVRQPPPRSGSPLWEKMRRAEGQYAARSLFRRDHQVTVRFFHRHAALRSFWDVYEGVAPMRPWIWHIHATGGVGKTTFLRWMVARHLLSAADGAACARIDFDDYRLDRLVRYPLRAVAAILRQLDVQMPDTPLTRAVTELDRIAAEPGWSEARLFGVQAQIDSARADTPVVIVLDTLEDMSRTQQQWMVRLIEQIGQLRTGMPRLILVLSGRYDVSALLPATLRASMRVHALARFSETEAQGYLETIEGVTAAPLRDAILERVAVEDVGSRAPVLYNPFKLSLLAEIVRDAPAMTPERVRALGSVDLAYLIERVILRIADQRLRWLVLYGVIARQLDRAFIAEVLLAELRDALLGVTDFDVATNDALGDYRGDAIWHRDAQAANDLDPDALVDALRGYASERGWISLDADGAVLRLHPEVVEPTRALLARQNVQARLHRRAIAYAERLATDPARWVEAKTLEIYHRYQLDHADGLRTWSRAIGDARRRGPDAVSGIASELLTRDYRDCEPALIAHARLYLARVEIDRAILGRREDGALRGGIAANVAAAIGIAPDAVDLAYDAIATRLAPADPMPEVADGRERADAQADLYEALGSAWDLSLQGRRSASMQALDAIGHARALMRDGAQAETIQDIDLALWANEIACREEDLPRAIGALRSAVAKGSTDGRGQRDDGSGRAQDPFAALRALAEVRSTRPPLYRARAAATLLLAHDPVGAKKAIGRLTARERGDAWQLDALHTDLALASADSGHLVLRDSLDLRQSDGDALRSIAILGKRGLLAAAYDFSLAEDLFREADGLVERTAGAVQAGALFDLLSLRVRAALRGMRNPAMAAQVLDIAWLDRMGPDEVRRIEALRNWSAILRGDAHSLTIAQPDLRSTGKDLRRSTLWMLAITGFGLASGGHDSTLRTVLNGQLPPPAALYEALEPAADRLVPFPAGAVDVEALVRRLPAIDDASPVALLDRARQADLLRLCGADDRARALVGRSLPERIDPACAIPALEYARCRARLDLDPEYARFADGGQGRSDPIPPGAVVAASGVLAAEHLATRGGDLSSAVRAISRAKPLFEATHVPNGWSQRIAEIEAAASGEQPATDTARFAADVGLRPLWSGRDAATPERPAASGAWRVCMIDPTTLEAQPSLRIRASSVHGAAETLRNWIADPRGFRAELSRTASLAPVRAGEPVTLHIDPMVRGTLGAALPWEMSDALDRASVIRRTYTIDGPVSRATPRRAGPGVILLPRLPTFRETRRGSGDLVERLRDIYRRRMATDELWSPDLREQGLVEAVARGKARPDIVHLVARMVEAKSGLALDFELGEAMDTARPTVAPVIASHLKTMLRRLPAPPFVILDIVTTGNAVADADMLVQRNAFAEEIVYYDPSLVRGLLATGLTPLRSCEDHWTLLTEAIDRNASIAELYAALRQAPVDPPDQIAGLYGPRATALWCDYPDVPAWMGG